jgi:hypothetical protein
MSNREFIVFSVVTAIVIAVLIHLFQPHWTGVTADPHSRVVDRYSSFEACQVRSSEDWWLVREKLQRE